MCLAIKYDKPYGRNWGWKLLYKEDEKYYTGICKAKRVRIRTDRFSKTRSKQEIQVQFTPKTYPTGFHIFTLKKDALGVLNPKSPLVLCKVEFKDQVAYGEVQWYHSFLWPAEKTKCVVARECKVLEEVSVAK